MPRTLRQEVRLLLNKIRRYLIDNKPDPQSLKYRELLQQALTPEEYAIMRRFSLEPGNDLEGLIGLEFIKSKQYTIEFVAGGVARLVLRTEDKPKQPTLLQ